MASGARRAIVIVVSTSAAAGVASDATGPVIVDWFTQRGFSVRGPIVVADGPEVGATLGDVLADAPEVIVTTGGTGVAPSDQTPEQTAPFLTIAVPGLIEELRRRGAAHVPAAVLTRGVAGFSDRTFVMNLPGSRGGVRDALAVLSDVLDHALAQRAETADGLHETRDPHDH